MKSYTWILLTILIVLNSSAIACSCTTYIGTLSDIKFDINLKLESLDLSAKSGHFIIINNTAQELSLAGTNIQNRLVVEGSQYFVQRLDLKTDGHWSWRVVTVGDGIVPPDRLVLTPMQAGAITMQIEPEVTAHSERFAYRNVFINKSGEKLFSSPYCLGNMAEEMEGKKWGQTRIN